MDVSLNEGPLEDPFHKAAVLYWGPKKGPDPNLEKNPSPRMPAKKPHD